MAVSKRLACAAELVRNNVNIADIGTDHAYLPCYLIESGKAKSAVASDINEGPLENARRTISEHKLNGKISTVLSDGLEKVDITYIDDIIIAGMGGELIAEIIDKCENLKDHDKHLVLQPMKNPDRLRKYLYANGFEIDREKACAEGGFCYCVMSVYYTGKIKEFDDAFYYVGLMAENKDNDSRIYIQNVLKKLLKAAEGIKDSGNIIEFEKKAALINAVEVYYDRCKTNI